LNGIYGLLRNADLRGNLIYGLERTWI